MGFNALVVEKNDEGKTSASVQSISEDQLPDGDVTVAVEYSTVNYKDGLCIGPGGGLVRCAKSAGEGRLAGAFAIRSERVSGNGRWNSRIYVDVGCHGVRGSRAENW